MAAYPSKLAPPTIPEIEKIEKIIPENVQPRTNIIIKEKKPVVSAQKLALEARKMIKMLDSVA